MAGLARIVEGVTQYKTLDALYGFPAEEIAAKACCEWDAFIEDFVDRWEYRYNCDPIPDVVKEARSNWKRGMTGYEAFQTWKRKASQL